MGDKNFSTFQTRLTVEIHFFLMYLPGLISGKWIAKHGPVKVCWLAVFFNVLGLTSLSFEGSSSLGSWMTGFSFLAVGWNLSFNSATVWLTTKCSPENGDKTLVQAANDCGMMLLSGLWIISGSYLYKEGSWLTLVGVVGGLVFCLAGLLLLHTLFNLLESRAITADVNVPDDDSFVKELDASERTSETIASNST